MSCDGCKYFMMCVRRYHESGRQQKCENFEPDRPHGEWIECEDNNYRKCSRCGIIAMNEEAEDFDYCPKCGADMRKEGDSDA